MLDILPENLYGCGFIHILPGVPKKKWNKRRIDQLAAILSRLEKTYKINYMYTTRDIARFINNSDKRIKKPYTVGEVSAALIVAGYLLVSPTIHATVAYANISAASLNTMLLQMEDLQLKLAG